MNKRLAAFLLVLSQIFFCSVYSAEIDRRSLADRIDKYVEEHFVEIMSDKDDEIAKQARDLDKKKLMKGLVIDIIKAYPRNSFSESECNEAERDTKSLFQMLRATLTSSTGSIDAQLGELKTKIVSSFKNYPVDDVKMAVLLTDFSHYSQEAVDKIISEYKKNGFKMVASAVPRSVVASADEITGTIMGFEKRQNEYDLVLNRYSEMYAREFLNHMRANGIFQLDQYTQSFYLKFVAFEGLKKKGTMEEVANFLADFVKVDMNGIIITEDFSIDLYRGYNKSMKILRQ